MRTNDQVVIDALLDIVVKVESSPKIVSPYGFRVVEWNGERVLTPLSADEYTAIMSAAGRTIDSRKLSSDPAGWCCVTTNLGCEVVGGIGQGGCCRVFHQDRIIGISCDCAGPPDARAGTLPL